METDETPPLIAHLESYLGPIEGGWRSDTVGSGTGSQVIQLRGSPDLPDVVPYATVGLSQHELESPSSGRPLRLELLMLITAAAASPTWASVLGQVAGELLASHTAIVRGQVIGPRGPLVPEATTHAFYAAIPVLLPDDFASCQLDTGKDVAIVWLMPITADEADYVADHGWRAFEDQLTTADMDLTDPRRPSVRQPGIGR